MFPTFACPFGAYSRHHGVVTHSSRQRHDLSRLRDKGLKDSADQEGFATGTGLALLGRIRRSRHEKRTSDRGARWVRTLQAWACITILKQEKEQ